MAAAKKIHPEDLEIAREIARAKFFTAYYRNGPHEKYVVRGIKTYAQACVERDALVAQYSRFGRKGIVYAVSALGSFPCDDHLIELAATLA